MTVQRSTTGTKRSFDEYISEGLEKQRIKNEQQVERVIKFLRQECEPEFRTIVFKSKYDKTRAMTEWDNIKRRRWNNQEPTDDDLDRLDSVDFGHMALNASKQNLNEKFQFDYFREHKLPSFFPDGRLDGLSKQNGGNLIINNGKYELVKPSVKCVGVSKADKTKTFDFKITRQDGVVGYGTAKWTRQGGGSQDNAMEEMSKFAKFADNYIQEHPDDDTFFCILLDGKRALKYKHTLDSIYSSHPRIYILTNSA